MRKLKDLCANTIFKHQIDYSNAHIPTDLKEELKVLHFSNFSTEKLFEKGCEDKEFALYILRNEKLYSKLGEYNAKRLLSAHEHAKTGEANIHSQHVKLISGEYLFKLSQSHKEVAEYILANDHLKERLSDPQKTELDKVTNSTVHNFYNSRMK